MTQPQDKMRADFELWAEHGFYSGMDSPELDWSDESNSYKTLAHHMAFCAWQAACAQQSAQSQQDALDAARWRMANSLARTKQYSGFRREIVLMFDVFGEKSFSDCIDESIATQGASNV